METRNSVLIATGRENLNIDLTMIIDIAIRNKNKNKNNNTSLKKSNLFI